VLEVGPLRVTLQTRNKRAHFMERTLSLMHAKEGKGSRVVIHLQFTEWSGHGFPASPSPLVQFVGDVRGYLAQQRGTRPMLLHCIPGVGKTGVFAVLLAAFQEIAEGCGNVPDLMQVRF
jgi:tyrosine-protein phosphatase non-receptor type 23